MVLADYNKERDRSSKLTAAPHRLARAKDTAQPGAAVLRKP